MTIKFPVGIDDFKKLMQGSYKEGFIDKTLFIKAILDENAETILIARPRRFGKTLNMSMLRYFFSNENVEENRQLFDETNIVEAFTEDGKSCLDFQGQYPVIFITLKSVRNIPTYELAYQKIATIISGLYLVHDYLLKSDILCEHDKKIYNEIISGKTNQIDLQYSLKNLTKYLHLYYGKKVIVLIDECDAPFRTSCISKNKYYNEMLSFMIGFFGEAFKGNEHLEKGVMIGTLRISLVTDMFSGVNNIITYSVLSDRYSKCFGFTKEEVEKLIDKTGLDVSDKDIEDWYGGYKIGESELYSPASVICCLDSGGEIEPYWFDIEDVDLIGRLLRNKYFWVESKLRNLLMNKDIECYIDKKTIFTDSEIDSEKIFGFLLYSGYLKILNLKIQYNEELKCKIPNKEVYGVYINFIYSWYEEVLGWDYYKRFIDSLVSGDTEYFESRLNDYLERLINYFDLRERTTETIYSVFVLSIIALLFNDYIIESDKKYGVSRFGITMIPRDNKKQGVILEFKSVKTEKELKKEAGIALKQIEKNKYNAELKLHDIKEAIHIGISFSGKNVCVKSSYKKYDS